MLKVHRVRADILRYQYFETDSLEFHSTTWTKFYGDSARAAWDAPPVHIYRPRNKEGHFFGFLGGGVFAVAAKTIEAYSALRTFFDQSGELLPFAHNNQEYFVFNCTNCINLLNLNSTVFFCATDMIDKYAFVPTRFSFSLFTIPETTKKNELLCVEASSDPDSDFKTCVEQNKLKGLVFEELWADDVTGSSQADDSESKPKKRKKK
jgi:hypothetical protein